MMMKTSNSSSYFSKLILSCNVLTLIFLMVISIDNIAIMAQQGNSNQTTNSTRLRIAVPVKDGFTELADVNRDPTTGEYIFKGYTIDIFKTVINSAMPYNVSFDFIPFAMPNGSMNGTYDDMLRAVSSGEYDAAVGDISIRYYRTEWVDFSMPFSETGVSMLVPLRLVAGNRKPSFLTRLPSGITAATVAVCGFSASILTFWFYARCQGTDSGETASRRTRLVIVLCFLMLVIITTCFGAIIIYLQVAPRQVPLVNRNMNDFIRNGRNVGCQTGSFVRNMLTQRGFSESQLKSYSNEEELVNLLSKGSIGGGVDAAIDETPYLKLFLAERCNAYTLVPLAALHADGFGFAFKKESRADLVRDISIATLKVTNNDEQLRNIKDRTIGDLDSCRENRIDATEFINWKPSLWILITGIAGVLALMLVCCPVYFECYKSITS